MNRRCFALFAALLLAPFAAAADKAMMFDIYADKAGEYRWRLKDANGTIVATGGQGYKAKADCKKMVENFKADISKYEFVLEEDNAKKTRFSLKAKNGQVVGSSSKGYDSKEEVEKIVEAIKKGAKDATVNDETAK